MNILDRARKLAAQKSVSFSEACSMLSRRRRRKTYGRTIVEKGAFDSVERPANYRLPYADN